MAEVNTTEEVVQDQQVEEPTEQVEETEGAAQEEPAEEEVRQYTKSEISKMMDQAVAKGRRLGKKDALKTVQGAPPAQQPDEDTQKVLDAKLKKANARMLNGTALGLASDVGLDSKGIKAAIKLCAEEFEECFDNDGELAEDDVKDILTKFVEDYPGFKVASSEVKSSTPYSRGSGTKKVSRTDEIAKALGLK